MALRSDRNGASVIYCLRGHVDAYYITYCLFEQFFSGEKTK